VPSGRGIPARVRARRGAVGPASTPGSEGAHDAPPSGARGTGVPDQSAQIVASTSAGTWCKTVSMPSFIAATTHDHLAEITVSAARAGKHVLVEKPAAIRADQLDDAIDAANRGRVCVRVGFNHRYHRAFRAARAFVDSVPHASGQNYVVGAGDGVFDVECSPAGTVEWMPGAPRVAHAHHPLVHQDRWAVAAGEPIVGLDGSVRRLAFLESHLVAGGASVTVDHCKELLSSAPVCRVPSDKGRAMSVFSTVMEVGPNPAMHVAPGPPSITGFERHGFRSA